MRILYICADAGIPVLGRKGASVHVRELIDAFVRAGHQVTLAAQTLTKLPEDKPAQVRARLIHEPSSPAAVAAVHAFKKFNEKLGLENSLPGELRRVLYNEALYQNLKSRFFRHRPAFIYERASLYATVGVRLAARFKVPLIVELNAPLALEHAEYRATGFGKLAAQAERWTLTNADAVVVVSQPLAVHVKALGVRPGRIHVMPNGVNPELFCPVAHRPTRIARFRQECGATGVARPTLGFVGGLRPWHGVEVLPQLLARLRKRHPNTRMIIVGDGQLRGELEREFKKRGLNKYITFAGSLLHEEIPTLIRQFDIALAPYPRHNHDFYFSPLKLFEYMACGVAVVAARQGQVAEVVHHGRTGLLYSPGDFRALIANCERLLANAPLRHRLGAAAARVVREKFTWDHNATRVIQLAKKLRA